jgi:hypothetical protein
MIAQEGEITRHKIMSKLKQTVAEGQVLKASTAYNPIPCFVLSSECFADLWSWESKGLEAQGFILDLREAMSVFSFDVVSYNIYLYRP